MHFEKVS